MGHCLQKIYIYRHTFCYSTLFDTLLKILAESTFSHSWTPKPGHAVQRITFFSLLPNFTPRPKVQGSDESKSIFYLLNGQTFDDVIDRQMQKVR